MQRGIRGTGVAPTPIDVRIERKTRVVTITGPNTGGKTAALKAIGCALYPKQVKGYMQGYVIIIPSEYEEQNAWEILLFPVCAIILFLC